MSSFVVRVEGIGKRYRLKHQRLGGHTTLRDTLSASARNIFGRRRSEGYRRATEEDFWALKDISFEIGQGDVVGFIGRNGAGKSTLLKILSRITEPTEGRLRIRGRVASLLEVGTGFHPELSGRENIFLNGAILGMTRAEIGRKFDEIVAFAEVEKFLDTPVKRYSSGMYVRLAFAVAAHMEPEILIVDEVLAVGDAEFQKKCLGKMGEVAKHGGRTVLFVSHNMAVVRDLCQRAMFIKNGRIAMDGECRSVVGAYLENAGGETSQSQWRRAEDTGDARAAIMELALRSADDLLVSELVMGDAVCIDMKLRFKESVDRPQFGVKVHATDGTPILDLRTRHNGLDLLKADGEMTLRAMIPSLALYPGEYLLSPWVTDAADRVLDWAQYVLKFNVLSRTCPYGDMRLSLAWGKYYVSTDWHVLNGAPARSS